MSRKIVLFTGSGFTKNFGGLLKPHIWSLMYSHPDCQANTHLKTYFLKHKSDGYESIYGDILNPQNGFNLEMPAMKAIIDDIYRHQERFIDLETNNIQSISAKLGKFIGTNIKEIFTLNQDLFIEKHIMNFIADNSGNVIPVDTPQAPRKIHDQLHHDVRLPNSTTTIKDTCCNKLLYVKLHGSYNWLDSTTGTNRVIIGGKNKAKQIPKEPLLLEYFKHFEEALNISNYLLIIGYGFMDDHINSILLKNQNLKIIVIDKLVQGGKDLLDKMTNPGSQGHLNNRTKEDSNRTMLVNRICGYYPIESMYDLLKSQSGRYLLEDIILKSTAS